MSSNEEDKNTKKHPGGPLQRTGKSADSWNEAVGSSISVIPQLYLPTKRTILRRYRFLRTNNELATTSDLAKDIGNEVIYIWNCARIPTCTAKNVYRFVTQVIDWWNHSGKDSKLIASRMSPEFQKELDQLCDIAEKPRGRSTEKKAHEYLNRIMQSKGKPKATGFEKKGKETDDQDWTDDMKFYLDQKGPRLKQMGATDEKLAKKEKKAYEQSSSTVTDPDTPVAGKQIQNDDNADNDAHVDFEAEDDDGDYTPAPGVKNSSSDEEYVTLNIPRDAMSQLSPLAYRLKLSTRQQTAFMAGVLKVGGANVKDTTLSVSTTHRQRHEGTHKKCLFIRENFRENLPPRMVVHWDGKKITYEKKKKKDERLCILGSFPGVEEDGVKKSDQFFGAPLVSDGTGTIAAQKVADTLSDWDIPESIIIGMSWDTTASNTGRKKGAATYFESRLSRAIFWLACRHHMGELHVKHPDMKIRILNTKAPEDIMFKKFQAIFESLPPCNYRLFEWPATLVHPMDFLTTRALDVLQWGTEQMREGTFNKQRDDYRELCELVVVYLGGAVSRKRKAGVTLIAFTMRHPGAFHQARFLHKALYLIKMSMMLDVLPDDVLPADKRESVDRMARFIVLFHAKYFLQAFLPAAGTRLDLQYWNDMTVYSRFDDEVAREVQDSILRQMWYFTEELSVLSLFDCGLEFRERSEIAGALLSHPKPLYFLPGRPTFPALSDQPEIVDFIGPRSGLLFNLLRKNSEWLRFPAEEWEGDEDYKEINTIVMNLSVTNDTAERAVKKVTEYANSADDGGQRGKIVEVAAWHHSKMSGYTKDEMENAI